MSELLNEFGTSESQVPILLFFSAFLVISATFFLTWLRNVHTLASVWGFWSEFRTLKA
jgi:hypothetical protein